MAPPLPSASIFSTPAFRQWKTPLTLTAYTRSSSAPVALSTSPTAEMPALFTRQSMRPCARKYFAKHARTAASSVTSHT